jgi:serine/threonine-protein kinase
MGQIWRATDQTLGRTVAVKFLRPRHLDDDGSLRFLGEARAMAALLHPGVATVYDYGQTRLDDGVAVAYLVMAWVAGQSLDDRIAAAGRLGAAETASIVAQAGRALQGRPRCRCRAPRRQAGEPDGRARRAGRPRRLRGRRSAARPGYDEVAEVVGTALYMAPEQAARRPISPATDVYALGAVTYHCLAGRPPFLGDNPVAVMMRHLQEEPPPLPDDVPPTLRHLVATAMAKDPAHRFPTAAAMAEAAEAAVRTDHRPAAAVTRPAPAPTRPKANTVTIALPPPRSGRPRTIVATLLA